MTREEFENLKAEAIPFVGTSIKSKDGDNRVIGTYYFMEIIPNEENGDFQPMALMRSNMSEEQLKPLDEIVNRFKDLHWKP